MNPTCKYVCYIPDIESNSDTHVSFYIIIQNNFHVTEIKSVNNEFFVILDDNDDGALEPNSTDPNRQTKTYIKRLGHDDPGDFISVEVNHDYDHYHTHDIISPQLITTHKVTHRIEDPRG